MCRYGLPLTLLAALLLYAGCDANSSFDESDAVLLRVANASEADFSSVTVSFPGAEADFGAVASGAVTDYRALATAYRYGLVEVVTNGTSYRLQPIDYVGEEPLPGGRYTYVLDIERQSLEFDFEQD